jgi:DNA-binding MarR family transcriptional regulator
MDVRGLRAPGVRSTSARSEQQPEAPLRLGKVLEFMRVLWAVDHGLETLSRRMETRLGVTAPQRFAMRLVGRFPDSAAGHIAALLAIHPSTLTGVLKRLEQRQLIERHQDVEDRRRTLLRLTDEGRRLDATRAGTVESALRRALGRFELAQLETAKEVLAAIAEELDRE